MWRENGLYEKMIGLTQWDAAEGEGRKQTAKAKLSSRGNTVIVLRV